MSPTWRLDGKDLTDGRRIMKMSSKDSRKARQGYTERLFGGRGIRSWLHNGRFLWFRSTLAALDLPYYKVIELGCFDGRLLSFMPTPPERYEGLDADWEGGLSRARIAFSGHRFCRFTKVTTPEAMSFFGDDVFNVAVSLETLEHVPPEMVDGYLRELARVTRGYLLISVPNEKGVVFLTKWLGKKFLGDATLRYRFSEWVAAILGRMDKVERYDHKGFDYDTLIDEIRKHFDVLRVEGVPMSMLPTWCAFTVCILAKSRDPD